MVKDLYRCPACKGKLQGAEGGSVLLCHSCHARWPIRDGIPCFLPEAALPDYGLAADMGGLAEVARAQGWLQALEQHLTRTGSRRDYVREYVASEARADFRFLMSLDENATVLDVGSGWGNIAIAFARTSRLVFALDTTLANLQFVKIRAHQEGLYNVEPLLGDAASLPLPPESCDGVLMVGVLEWVPWGREDGTPRDLQTRALAEACQVLRPGGQLYVAIENRFGFKSLLGVREPHTGLRFVSLLPRSLGDLYSRWLRGKPFREWTHSQAGLTRLLKEAGFSMIDFYYPIPSYQNFRYITDYSAPWIGRFLISRFAGHARFTAGLRVAGSVASILRIERWVSPCFSVVARKSHD
jgi:ubiquinone/menaquinone biosynthesis C-methylase UbiE/uncharacterized protein YbaR (Trm112 family)